MRKNIFIGFVSVGIAVSCLVAIMSGFMFQRVILDIVKEDILQFSLLMHEELEERVVQNNDWNLGKLIESDYRLSVMEADGRVIFDSSLPVAEMENHADREEVRQANELGYGESTRYSKSLRQATYYYARKLSNGMIMRLSKSTDSWISVFAKYLPIASIMLGFILLFAFTVSSRISLAITKPIESLVKSFQSDSASVPYKELQPFQTMMMRQRVQINDQMNQLRRERDKLTGLINHMNEGFLILDMERRIISINEAAVAMLKARAGSYFYKNVMALTRNHEFFDALDNAYTGVHQTKIIRLDNKSIRFFMSAIEDNGNLDGVMVFLLDVSEQIRLEKIRREFTSNVSHELKTPLTSISGFAEMIHSDMIASLADAKYFAGKILQESNRLFQMVSEILRLSQIEEAVIKEFDTIDLSSVVTQAIDQLQVVADKKQVALIFDEHPVRLQANRNLLMELVYNLINNAIRYNKEGGHVWITVKLINDSVELRVKDEGIGIDTKYQERIFERFFTVDKSHSKQQGGTGLGLSIVKHIIEYHHGSIKIESVVGEGSEFIVQLPCVQEKNES